MITIIVLHQASNGVHWIIDHMTDVPESDQQELANLQQRARNTALVFTAHPQLHGFAWSLTPSINNMHAFKALQHQPFHRAKRKLYPALMAVITRLNSEPAYSIATTFRCHSHRHNYRKTTTLSQTTRSGFATE